MLKNLAASQHISILPSHRSKTNSNLHRIEVNESSTGCRSCFQTVIERETLKAAQKNAIAAKAGEWPLLLLVREEIDCGGHLLSGTIRKESISAENLHLMFDIQLRAVSLKPSASSERGYS